MEFAVYACNICCYVFVDVVGSGNRIQNSKSAFGIVQFNWKVVQGFLENSWNVSNIVVRRICAVVYLYIRSNLSDILHIGKHRNVLFYSLYGSFDFLVLRQKICGL